jgi:tetraacyldisaccharide 4'-kinase
MARTLARPLWQTKLLVAWQSRHVLACLLWPLSLLYRLLVRLRLALYRGGVLSATRLPVPLVVVGNVVAGGSGKTPVVIALVEGLQARGLKVGVVSRGYGRRSKACVAVQVDSTPHEVGDEPLLIHRRTQAPVFVAPSRVQAAQSLLATHPETDLIISDDGLQHLSLQRELEIGVFDDRGVGNGWLLPAGPLREPWPRHLDLIVHTGQTPRFEGFLATRTLSSQGIDGSGQQRDLSSLQQAPDARPLMAIAAIAQPERFFEMLRQQGLHLDRTLALPDHDDFQHWSSQTAQGYQILCTEKDAVKLWPLEPQALAVPLQCSLGPDFEQALLALLRTRCPHARAARALSSAHGHPTT